MDISGGSVTPTSDAPEATVIIVEGEIGAGKTTLIKQLVAEYARRGLKAAVVPEPVDEWKRVGILQEFYADKPKEYRGLVAYDFQTYTFVTRIMEAQRVVRENSDADVFIMERSVWTDRFVFMELQREMVGPARMEMYDKWWAMWVDLVPARLVAAKTSIVYLKPSLPSCQSRVGKRARIGEVNASNADTTDTEASARGGVSAAYQERLRIAHEAFLQGMHQEEFPHMPPRPFNMHTDVIIVGGKIADSDFSEEGKAADRITSLVIEKCAA